MPAPPMPTKWSARPANGSAAGSPDQAAATPPPPAPPRPASPPRGRRSTSRPSAAAPRAGRPPRGPGAGRPARASGITTAAPARSMKRAFASWWLPVACGYGTRIDGRPGGGQLEHGAARARGGEVRGGQRVRERLDVREQPVVRRRAELDEPRAQLLVVAPPGRVEHRARRGGAEGVEGGVVQPPRAQRAAEDEQAWPVRRARPGARGPRPGRPPRCPRGTGRPVTSHFAPRRPSIGNARHTRAANGASIRFDTPRWLSASVSTSGRPRVRAASPTGPAT